MPPLVSSYRVSFLVLCFGFVGFGSQNGSQMTLKKVQNSSLEASGQLVACLGEPWGAKVDFLTDFGGHSGTLLGFQNHSNMDRNSRSKRASPFVIVCGPLGASGVIFGTHFGGHVGCFFHYQNGMHKFVKSCSRLWREHDF